VRDREDHLGRMTVSQEMVELAADRLDLWDEVRELAGVKVSERVRRGLTKPLEREYEKKLAALRQEYEQKIAELKDSYPAKITRRIAEALVGGGLTGFGEAGPAAAPPMAAPPPAAEPVRESAASPEPARAVQVEPVVEAEEGEGIEPYIDTELCTTCNECTTLNPRMFAYNADKKAYVKDPRAGTFAQLVQAAEKCTARIIHPGTPLDPDEPDLEKWVKRAQPFN
jgi:pyruvate-ferredoxin/flavodoxin oxidoreductase